MKKRTFLLLCLSFFCVQLADAEENELLSKEFNNYENELYQKRAALENKLEMNKDAEVSASYGYFSLGASLLMPNIGIGYRFREGAFTADMNINAQLIYYMLLPWPIITSNLLYGRNYYAGGGVTYIIGGRAHPQVVFGKNLSQRSFLEISFFADIISREYTTWIPSTSVRYGHSF